MGFTPRKISLSVSLMDRYFIQAIYGFFLLSFGMMTAAGVAMGTVADLVKQITEDDLPIAIACQIFGCKIPEYAVYALPISVLLSCLVVYDRLSDRSELTALLSFGISFYRLILPALLFSLAIAGMTFILNEFVVPAANYRVSLLQNFALPSASNPQRNIFYAEYKSTTTKTKQLQRIYFAELYLAPQLHEITVLNFASDRLDSIITAKSASWNRQQALWELHFGTMHRFVVRNKRDLVETIEISQLPLARTVFEIAERSRGIEQMSIRQTKAHLRAIEDSGQPRELTALSVRIQQKYAFPFICVVFALVGAVLGGKYSQLNRGRSFALCVAIVFCYYFLGVVTGALGITGAIAPILAGWLPNIIALAIGLCLWRFNS